MTDELLFPNRALVKVLAPVHIGTGEKLAHLSFARLGSEMIVFDADRLTQWAGADERRLAEFVSVVESAAKAQTTDQQADAARQFQRWLTSKGKSAEDFAAYRVGVSTLNKLRDVMPFIKTAGQHPYLPGSSVKGSLRSALLRGLLNLQPERAGDLTERAEPLAEAGKRSISEDLQAQVFVPARVERSKYSNYDLNRTVMLTDSNLKSTSDLEVVEVKVHSTQTDHTLVGKSWSIFAETLRVGTQCRLSLTRATHLLAGLGAADRLQFTNDSWLIVELAALCRVAALDIIAQEIKFYHDYRQADVAGWYEDKRDQLKAITDQRFMLPIGWGSGYDAKTVTDLLGDAVFGFVSENYRNTKGLGRPGNSPGSDWLGPDLSPKSRKLVLRYTRNGGIELEPVGWLVVKLEAFDEPNEMWKTLTERASLTMDSLTVDAEMGDQAGVTISGQVVADTPPSAEPPQAIKTAATPEPAPEPEVSDEAKRIAKLMAKKAEQREAEEERKRQARAEKKKRR